MYSNKKIYIHLSKVSIPSNIFIVSYRTVVFDGFDGIDEVSISLHI